MRKNILVIENDSSLSGQLASLLSGECEIISTRNGYEALSWVQYGNHAHMLIADADIPVLNPYDIKQCIRKLNGMMDMPVIYISTRETVMTDMMTARDRFMKKPCNIAELVSAVRQQLGIHVINH